MTCLTRLAKGSFAASLVFGLSACGNDAETQVGRNADGMPQGDTGWQVREEGEGLRMRRQLDQLTLVYALEPKSGGVGATLTARAAPCLGGKGEFEVEDTFTPLSADEASELTDIRDRMESLVGRVTDRCDIPDKVRNQITAGFDGLFFRTSGQRAAVSAS
ncbi:hypothetical protein [Erythrobacter sp. SD-21]|uniref:hypothetical protein n=1 Tax=Erythrobacter sp. SD-21 TaxID=161528 RepID=UPI0012E9EEA1|nr:hypothetical protein [Erythrobacter sp. SD-21]